MVLRVKLRHLAYKARVHPTELLSGPHSSFGSIGMADFITSTTLGSPAESALVA